MFPTVLWGKFVQMMMVTRPLLFGMVMMMVCTMTMVGVMLVIVVIVIALVRVRFCALFRALRVVFLVVVLFVMCGMAIAVGVSLFGITEFITRIVVVMGFGRDCRHGFTLVEYGRVCRR